jgi:hypothetical protein
MIMKFSKLLSGLALLLAIYSTASAAEIFAATKKIYCGETSVIVEFLLGEDYEEVPAWGGKDAETNSSFVLMVNSKTKTWTIIQMNDEVACLIGSGSDSTRFNLGKKVSSF